MNYRQKVLSITMWAITFNTFIIISFYKFGDELNGVPMISNAHPHSHIPNTSPNLQIYGTLVSDCDALIHSLYLTLNIFKLDSLKDDKKLYPMHIFWTVDYNRPKSQTYEKLLHNTTYKSLINDLKHLIYDNVIDPKLKLNKSNFDIKFLLRNDSITIPELFLQKYNKLMRSPFPMAWRLAFDKLLLFDKANQLKDYKSILMLDIDMIFIKSIKHLFNTYTPDIKLVMPSISDYFQMSGIWRNKHLNGGITLIKPDANIFDKILEISRRNITNYQKLREIYVTSEQTFYEYLFLGSKKQRHYRLNDTGSNMKILPEYYNQIPQYCSHRNVSFYKDVVSWHFTTSPKAWNLVVYDEKLKKNKINNGHWYIDRWKNRFANKTSYNDTSYANMDQSNCEYVILSKWLEEMYNTYYHKMETIKHKCHEIVSQYY